VLGLVACGFSNKAIADALVISRKTAANHVEHIYAKIGASNRARAALFAMQQGLMTDVAARERDERPGRIGSEDEADTPCTPPPRCLSCG
jgi:hypothetical protein